jgi:hypothetical protein
MAYMTYKPQGTAHYILATLNDLGTTQINTLQKMAASTRCSRKVFKVDFVEPMVIKGDIKAFHDSSTYSITNQGIQKLNSLQDLKPVSIFSGKAEQRTIKQNSMRDRPDYTGDELDQTCMRPGAYDFLKCPSLVLGVRYYRKDAPV